ncbi:agmatinase [Saccharolobus solfataricus]|uniref:Agmatinase (Agmatine ureohydrolase) (SpeB-2) n=3 Tax=Saccharolobus solfataricus TaxID=2287 RepID=Q97VA3_SACS2|nr:agmatinase [Saccharolobus solfataricus]AAK42842.1 Agmatinase (agmatine ureohydrolase) (speB-2) [Saccharolobus solfataricus P2]AKA72932.1 agmatinase [Saccharolobus solfataricus]AKA75631.1 agmatinase [Saccharolobus solfataricus]AKA78324.1 agmatinase [Saccharolobus solfataricus]AZF67443.1 agmatinase [Saccharolobus solfataricus]
MRQLDALKSPRFTQISTFGRLPICEKNEEIKAAFLGIPFDDAVTYRPGARFGPMGIRQGSRLLRPYNQFLDTYPFDKLNACDMGDINVIPGYIEDTMNAIQTSLYEIISSKNLVPFIAGGDHSITLPILRTLYKKFGKINIVHFDSHYDFWDSYWGKKYTHGTWLRRAIEEGLIKEAVQGGIRASTFSKEDLRDKERLGIRSFTIRDLKYNLDTVIREINSLSGPTHVSIDIDVVDPAFAPGTGTPEVGGLTSFEIIEIVRKLRFDKLVGFDVVEVAPPYDMSEITAMLAANIIYEGMSVLSLNL